jgi:hypothetical protein
MNTSIEKKKRNKVCNFIINLTAESVKGLGIVFSAIIGILMLVGLCFVTLYVLGYIVNLFGIRMPVRGDSIDVTIFTGYSVFLVAAFVFLLLSIIRELCRKLIKIWKSS